MPVDSPPKELEGEGGLRARLESPLPERLVVGRGTCVLVHGWAFHPDGPVKRLRIRAGGESVEPVASAMPRSDVRAQLAEAGDPGTASEHSGFWAVVPVSRRRVPERLTLELEAELPGGASSAVELGELVVTPTGGRDYRLSSWPKPLLDRGMPRVCILMATYNPEPEAFSEQIESIRAQTRGDWECLIFDDHSEPTGFDRMLEIVGDDARFSIYRAESNAGFYANFERALTHAPFHCEFVALADQDDRWHPEKLERLIAALGDDGMLAFCQSRILLARDGIEHLMADSYFDHTGTANGYESLSSLLISNSVTGAASVFRRHLLTYALPFPRAAGIELHDQWLAVCARSLGPIAYVAEPLHDQIDHGANATRNIDLWWRSPPPPDKIGARDRRLRWWREIYQRECLRLLIWGRILRMRCWEISGPRERRVIDAAASLDGARGLAWLAGRGAIPRRMRTETVGLEPLLLRGALWPRAARRHGTGDDRPLLPVEDR